MSATTSVVRIAADLRRHTRPVVKGRPARDRRSRKQTERPSSGYQVFRKFGECAAFGIRLYAELLEWRIKAIDPESTKAK
jgi:hypothetical protein